MITKPNKAVIDIVAQVKEFMQDGAKEGAREITFWITLVSQFIGAFATVLSGGFSYWCLYSHGFKSPQWFTS